MDIKEKFSLEWGDPKPFCPDEFKVKLKEIMDAARKRSMAPTPPYDPELTNPLNNNDTA